MSTPASIASWEKSMASWAPAHLHAYLVDPVDLIPGQRVGLTRAAAGQEGADLEVDEALERLAVGVFIQRLGRGEQGAVTGE